MLVEGPSKAAEESPQETNVVQMMGRTHCDRIVVFEGNRRQAGQILPVTIYEVSPHTLFGQVITDCVGPEVYTLNV